MHFQWVCLLHAWGTVNLAIVYFSMVSKTDILFLYVNNISNFENYFTFLPLLHFFTINQEKRQTETRTVAIDDVSSAVNCATIDLNLRRKPTKRCSLFERCLHTEIWKVRGIKNIEYWHKVKWILYVLQCTCIFSPLTCIFDFNPD